MDPAREKLLDELDAYGRAHDAQQADRLLRLRNVEPETGAMLAVLVRACGARSLLELGTSNGYSTVWLGDAAADSGGRLLSVDVDPERTAQARETIARARLEQTVALRSEDAAQTLAAQADAAVDFIFLDAERPAYVSYWPDLVRILARPGLLAVDNAISHREEMAELSEQVAQDRRVFVALVPVGAGVLLITRR